MLKDRYTFFIALREILFTKHYSNKYTISNKYFSDTVRIKILVSSENIIGLSIIVEYGRLFTKIGTRRGQPIEPCATPHAIISREHSLHQRKCLFS